MLHEGIFRIYKGKEILETHRNIREAATLAMLRAEEIDKAQGLREGSLRSAVTQLKLIIEDAEKVFDFFRQEDEYRLTMREASSLFLLPHRSNVEWRAHMDRAVEGLAKDPIRNLSDSTAALFGFSKEKGNLN